MFHRQEATYSGRACYLHNDSDLRTKVEFITLNTHECYEALKATILNRKDGAVDNTTIYFEDLFGVKRGQSMSVVPHIWRINEKFEWYAYKPSPLDYDALAAAVGKYMSVFSDHDLVPEKTQAPTSEKKSVVDKLRDNKRSLETGKKSSSKIKEER
jgi:hypothetical protein